METHLTRKEIRRQILATLGDSTDELLARNKKNQINALIDAASQEVAAFATWYCQERKASTRLEESSDFISYYDLEKAYWLTENYPNYYRPLTYGTSVDTWDTQSTPVIYPVGPCGVKEVAVWYDGGKQWVILKDRVLSLATDPERLRAGPAEEELIAIADGDTQDEIDARVASREAQRDAARDVPLFYEKEHNGIRFNLPANIDYVVRVKYQVFPTWAYHNQTLTAEQTDLMESAVDGLAIMYKAVALMYGHKGDKFMANVYETKGVDRMRDVRAWMNTEGTYRVNNAVSFNDDIGGDPSARYNYNPGY